MYERTLTERIIDALIHSDDGLSAKDIIRLLELDPSVENEVYRIIEKLPKILKKKELSLMMSPPQCKSCGFEFKKIKATKCPKCKGERIKPAIFLLR
jgi:hypothetical protein